MPRLTHRDTKRPLGPIAAPWARRRIERAEMIVLAAILAVTMLATGRTVWAQDGGMPDDGTVMYDQSFLGEEAQLVVGPDGSIVIDNSAYPTVAADCGGCGYCSWCLRHGGWFEIDYLLWWNDPLHVPALVTTAPDDGVLPSGTILLGDENLPDDSRSGVRIDLGMWLDDCRTLGIGATYFSLEDADFSYSFQSDGSPILARPFLDGQTLEATSDVVASPDVSNARIKVKFTSGVDGGDVYFRGLADQTSCSWLDYIVGYQYASIDESFSMRAVLDFTGEIFPEGQQTTVRDFIKTENDFNGVEVGLLRQCDWGVWGVRTLAKLGIGNMRQRVRISGSTVTTVPGSPTVSDGDGFLTASTNDGLHIRDQFAVVPELGVTLTRRLTCNSDLVIGYSLIYYSDIVRSTDQLDTIDGQPVIGNGRPRFEFDSDGFLLQGLNIGLQVRR